MPPKRRPQSARNKPSATPIDARQQALLEEQAKVAQQMEQLQRMIQEAPRKAEEKKKQRQEELRTRRLENAVLIDRRFEAATVAMPGPRRPPRPLRKHQRQGRIMFLALLAGLILLVMWLCSVWRW